MTRPSVRIAIIADDITGAADTGVQFCPAVGPVLMTGITEKGWAGMAVQAKGVSVFTGTRHMDAAGAAETVRQACLMIRPLNPEFIYKKIDSCLRGNLGAELDALLHAAGKPASFVVPAFPEQGRTTVNDCHLIAGVPVAETEMGRDPLGPVSESRLSVLLSSQSRLPVGHVPLSILDAGPLLLAERIGELLHQGCRHIAFDAVQRGHLDTIATVAADRFPDALLAGSAGMAKSLAQTMMQFPSEPEPAERPGISKWLFVCGSATQVLADQVEVLVRSTGWTHLTLDPLTLACYEDRILFDRLLTGLAISGRTGNLILSIRPLPAGGPVVDPRQVVRGLAKVAGAALAFFHPDGVFLSGGDTAEAFWQQIRASAVLIREEILPGLMRGEFIGGPFSTLAVVTKAGAFGKADTLKEMSADSN